MNHHRSQLEADAAEAVELKKRFKKKEDMYRYLGVNKVSKVVESFYFIYWCYLIFLNLL